MAALSLNSGSFGSVNPGSAIRGLFAGDAPGSSAVVADEPAREADQERRQGRAANGGYVIFQPGTPRTPPMASACAIGMLPFTPIPGHLGNVGLT